ncbi:MAG TPA: hypothetical protein VFZ23_05365 [Pyrinomonadaceae bacterium]
MSTLRKNPLEDYLNRFTETDWQDTLSSLLPAIHEVDRNAVQIWFRFYPLSVHRYLSSASDPKEAERTLAMQGDFGLKNHIDSSHVFLYGHRYWRAVKSSIEDESNQFVIDAAPALADEIKRVAAAAAENVGVREPLLLGITAIGLMTLTQVGLENFKAARGEVEKPKGLLAKSPEAIVAARTTDDSQGLFGFLKTVNKKFSVIYDESSGRGRFEILNDQEIASASANDRSQKWQEKDPRCWEGPVPVECTSASCGTCWVGILAGEEKLSEVARREGRAVKIFGYNQSEEANPIIRLACQAKAYGNVTIVIPPWNAVFGKKVYGNVEELELEPATTSAKRLRDTISSAASSGD